MSRSRKPKIKKEMTAEEVADFKKTLMDVAAILMPDMVGESFDSFVSEVRPTADGDEREAECRENPYEEIQKAIEKYARENALRAEINAELLRREMKKRKGEKK